MLGRQKGLHFYKKRKKVNMAILQEVGSWFFCIGVSILIAYVCVFAFGMKTSVIGVSMEPNLYNGQKVLINRFIYQLSSPKRGDIIAFLPNGNQNSHYYVKRVAGIPGETIQVKEGKLYIDGVVNEEITYDKIAEPGLAEDAVTLGADEYFVLGDNINSSEDSRSAGMGSIKKDTIIGKAWFKTAAKNSGLGFIVS